MTESLLLYYGLFFFEFLIGSTVQKRANKPVMRVNSSESKVTVSLNQLLLLIFSVSVPIILATFRYNVGSDYYSYQLLFERYSEESLRSFIASSNIEIGFFLICKVSSIVFGDYSGLLFIIAIIIYSLGIVALSNYRNYMDYGPAYLLFFILFLGPSFNIMRQIIAVMIVFWGFVYIIKRKPVHYIIVVLIATTFHTSALLCIPFYFLYFKQKNNYSFREIVLIITILFIPFLLDYLTSLLSKISVFSEYAHYYENIAYTGNLNVLIIKFPIIFLVFFYWRKLLDVNEYNLLFLLLFVLECASIVMGFFIHWAMRVKYYCLISEVILIPQILTLEKSRYRYLLLAGSMFYYSLNFYWCFYKWGNDRIFPFQFG